MTKLPLITFVFILLAFSETLSAQQNTSNTNHYLNESQLTELSHDREWLDLLHYHQIGLFSSFESQADDPAFFFAKQGNKDPKAELYATLEALAGSDYTKDSAICRFPARLHWLQTKDLLSDKDAMQCLEFSEWFHKIDADSLTLAFPAAYLNSPSSMYGHTFIRINRKHGQNPLLDYSVNYAANADPNDNELVFSFKGLSGGYPGVFSVLPYYQKVTEYSFLEARDVWEYQLNLTTEEVAQFVRHAWEIQTTHFDYYFFDENCSYHLLTLLDVASERFNLSEKFALSAIPADTVRAIREAGLISHAEFRPSTMSLLTHMLNESANELHGKAKLLVDNDVDINTVITSHNSVEQAQILELAYQYSRYLSVRKKQDQKAQAKKAISILSARSKVAETRVFSEHPRPKYRDDEGHHSHRFEASFGQFNKNNYQQLGLRIAYHDRLDNLPGYLKGAKLEMFHAKVRHIQNKFDRDRTRLEEFKLIDIASYSPRNDFLSPISWEVSTGFKRPEAEHEELVAFLSTGWGHSYLLGNQQLYGLAFFDLYADDDIDKGHHFSTGPKLGWLSQHEYWSMNLELKQNFDISGADYATRSIEFGISRNIAKHWQLRITSQYLHHQQPASNSNHSKEASLSLMHYF